MVKTREKILKVGAEIIAHEGLRKFTAKNLAQKIGISDAAIFKHFSSMNEIAEEIIRRYTNECILRTKEAVALGKTPTEKMEKILEGHMELLEKTRGIIPIICFEFSRSDKRSLKRKIHEFLEEYGSILKEVIREGIKKDEFRDDIDVDEAAFSLIGFMQAKAFQWFLKGKKGKIIRDPETVKKLILYGLKKS
ncbi:MAG: TetR/AcrR family transcriptional regulator [Aquifex sp.]|nr:MAG: TetR/AcrR family transcriptional regulator [Aquifex sp.]